MITYKAHGKMGNLGNQLFQLASILGFSKKYDAPWQVPRWKYAQFFDSSIPQSDHEEQTHIELQEPQFHYTPEWWDVNSANYRSKNVNITGWLQSERYFDHCADEIRKMFTFKVDFEQGVKVKFLDSFTKPTIAISIRRGDYVDNPNYELLPIKYYLLALLNNFPDFRENYNIIIFSDDFNYCKVHFKCLPNVVFAEGLSDIEQICLGSQCDNFIIANSTFSWWMAWLGQKEHSRIVHPHFLFAGQLKKNNQEWSFWPERQGWFRLDHKTQNLDLKDVTFTIPVKYDSKDRLDNCTLILKLLRNDFDCDIVVGEQGHFRFEHLKDIVRYVKFDGMDKFHRTKMLNDMAGDVKTPIVVNYDCDVAIPPLQLIEAAHLIRTKKAEMVYPYDGRFARVPRPRWYKEIDSKSDVGMFGKSDFPGMRSHDALSVGGCIMFDTIAFVNGGMENENFISYGPEDAERYDRFNALGYKVARVHGVLYHFDHVLGADSSVQHPYFNHNKAELEKIRSMDKAALRAYVDSWPWTTKYRPSYYEAIVDESVRSRDVVFKVLEEWGVLKDGSSIVDAGCALGSWGKDSTYLYTGIDSGVPLEKLVISKDQYFEHDLRKSIKGIVYEGMMLGKFDLCLCLEVAEHLEPEYADQLIYNLCLLSDTVLFSAAIPGQGGINHFNEQWQSYWAEKFRARGYTPDPTDIRERIWNDENVGLWYRQNLVLYTKNNSGLPDVGWPPAYQLDRIHPQMYMNLMRHYKILK